AILVVNNVRDLETDRRAGKRTLAVRLGRARTRTLYTAMLAGAFVTAPLPWALGSMTAWLLLPWATIPLAVRLATPLQSASGAARERELLTVVLTDADGVAGYGEAAPLEPYDGVSMARVQRALERYRPLLAAWDGANGAELIEACRRAEDLPAALAAIDLALWDRAGRREGNPVAALLTDEPAAAVPVNATLSAPDRAGVATQAAEAVRAGFSCLKLKVGAGDDAA